MSGLARLSPEEFEAIRPRIAPDAIARAYDDGIVAWSPSSPRLMPLTDVAAIVFQILDGTGTVAELVQDVHEVVGVSEAVARNQLRRVLDDLASSGLIDGVEPDETDFTEIDLFPAPPNP